MLKLKHDGMCSRERERRKIKAFSFVTFGSRDGSERKNDQTNRKVNKPLQNRILTTVGLSRASVIQSGLLYFSRPVKLLTGSWNWWWEKFQHSWMTVINYTKGKQRNYFCRSKKITPRTNKDSGDCNNEVSESVKPFSCHCCSQWGNFIINTQYKVLCENWMVEGSNRTRAITRWSQNAATNTS